MKKIITIYTKFLLIIGLVFWSSKRGNLGADTQVYLLFYEQSILNGLVSINSCQSFEPLFCVISFFVGRIFNSSLIVHLFWVFLYYLLSTLSFLKIYNLIGVKNYYSNFLFYLIFALINFTDPHIIYFLTRQYVASAIVIFGVVRIIENKNPIAPFFLAFLIHFGVAPIIFILYIFSNFSIKKLLTLTGLLIGSFFAVILYDMYIIEVYFESIKYKIYAYQSKNDGTVTLLEEIKLLLYWFALILFASSVKPRLALALFFIYLFYIATGFNDLIHLRYHKYLISLCWPGVFVILLYFKRSGLPILISALSYRSFKYLSSLIGF